MTLFSSVSHLDTYYSGMIVYISLLSCILDSAVGNWSEFLFCCFCALMLVPLLCNGSLDIGWFNAL